MNFDFLKGLNGLDSAYTPSTSAEKLVRSDPSMSVVASRRSAEILAKFIYLTAHTQKAQDMTFVDILADPDVRKFINDRNVMDAFHYIRKNGNKGAHAEQPVDEKQALSVLQKLHYAAGETAKDLALISSYPEFDDNIGLYPDATFDDQFSVSEQAMQLFLEYVKAHQKDEHGHLVKFDFDNPFHAEYLSHSEAELHERIEFEHQPYCKSTLEYLQNYLSFMDDRADERQSCYGDPCRVKVIITLDGEEVPEKEWPDALMKRLPEAHRFTIDLYAAGIFRAFDQYMVVDEVDEKKVLSLDLGVIDENEPWQGRGMADYLEGIKRRENFIYKAIFRYSDNTHTEFVYIRNGKSYDVADLCKPDIVQRAKGYAFYGEMMMMHADFDHHAHMPVLQQLRDAVRAYVPPEALSQLEENWEELEEEDSYGYLLTGSIDIDNDGDLSRTQTFIDQFNQILAPIADQCTIYMDYPVTTSKDPRPDPALPALRHCFYDMQNFAVASFIWKDQRLQLVGTIL